MSDIQPGWYQDPENAELQRWWDGSGWGPSLAEEDQAPALPVTPEAPVVPTTPAATPPQPGGYGSGGYGSGGADAFVPPVEDPSPEFHGGPPPVVTPQAHRPPQGAGAIAGGYGGGYGPTPSTPSVGLTGQGSGLILHDVLNMIFCCMPLGIAGLIFAIMGNSSGDRSQLAMAAKLNRWGTIAGLVYVVCVILYVVSVMATAHSCPAGSTTC